MIRRVRNGRFDIPTDGSPWIADVRTYDISTTIANMIRMAAPGCVAVTLRPVGQEMIIAAERAARRRGIRILWVKTPKDHLGHPGNETPWRRS